MKPGSQWRVSVGGDESGPLFETSDKEHNGVFDELVIDGVVHIEHLDDRDWYVRVGDTMLNIHVGRKGTYVTVVEAGENLVHIDGWERKR